MADPFIGEIKIFAGNFAPREHAFCDGQLLPIAQNTALFAILGTTFGGDGRTTLGLPDLRGRAAMHPGNGPGLTSRRLGEAGGAPTHTLTAAEMADHTHTMSGSTADTDEEGTTDPAGNTPGTMANADAAYGPATNLVAMATEALPPVGGGGPHNNLQPYQVLNYIIALSGIFPSQS